RCVKGVPGNRSAVASVLALVVTIRKVALAGMAAGLVGCDHATKWVAEGTLAGAPAVRIVELRYAPNVDVAFSLFRTLGVRVPDEAIVALTLVATLLVGVVWWWSRREPSAWIHAGFAAVLAGA